MQGIQRNAILRYMLMGLRPLAADPITAQSPALA